MRSLIQFRLLVPLCLLVFWGGPVARSQPVEVVTQPGFVLEGFPVDQIEPGEPILIGVEAPKTFELGNPDELVLLVGVEAENLSPIQDGEIFIRVFDMWGKPIEVPVLNSLTSRGILIGDKLIGINIGQAAQFRGEKFSVKICAFSKQIRGNPCAIVDLIDKGSPLDEPVKQNKDLIELLKKRFAGIGCRCKSSVIRMSQKQTSHGSLGKFTAVTGGAKYGPFHATDNVKKLINSNFKFEPHFEIEIINRPKKPRGYSAAAWSEVEKAFPALCTEGQRINGTDFFRAGTPNEVKFHLTEKVAGASVDKPYADTRDIKKFKWDAHGYRVTGKGKGTVKGNVKAHEKNIVHWLDSAGINQKGQATFARVAPSQSQYFFHAFVHGSTGKAADNCDCFFGIQTAVVAKGGVAQAPKVLKKPVCK